jgi:hypothetical protein
MALSVTVTLSLLGGVLAGDVAFGFGRADRSAWPAAVSLCAVVGVLGWIAVATAICAN